LEHGHILNARQTDTFEKINRTCFGINDLSLQRTLDPSCILACAFREIDWLFVGKCIQVQ